MTVATFHTSVRSGWRQALMSVDGIPAAVAWEARHFEPVVGTPWIRETFRPVTSAVRALGAGGTVSHRMLAVATLFYPAGQGTAAIEAAAGALLAGIPPARSIVHSGVAAMVLQAERGPLISEPDWISCPVSFTLVGHSVN